MSGLNYSKWDGLDSDEEGTNGKTHQAKPVSGSGSQTAVTGAVPNVGAARVNHLNSSAGTTFGGGFQGMMQSMQVPAGPNASTAIDGDANGGPQTVEQLKEAGNQAFKKAQMLRRTTAGKQYLNEARCSYIEAIQALGQEPADERAFSLACTLHTNLSQVHLMEVPPNFEKAKAAAEIALHVNPKHVKALYRRAQALLEDGREGLPEESLRAAFENLQTAAELEPSNAQVTAEAERVRRRISAIEEARRVPEPKEITDRIPEGLLDRGASCMFRYGYVWGQTEEVVHILVPVRGVRLTKASEATCQIKPTSVRIVLPCAKDQPEFELQGALHKPVRPDDCSWQLEDRGLLLHVELAKRDTDKETEHWERVWKEHMECKVKSPDEQKALQQFNDAAKLAADEHLKKEKVPDNPNAKETVRRLREMCPGVDIEWGDTSLKEFRD